MSFSRFLSKNNGNTLVCPTTIVFIISLVMWNVGAWTENTHIDVCIWIPKEEIVYLNYKKIKCAAVVVDGGCSWIVSLKSCSIGGFYGWGDCSTELEGSCLAENVSWGRERKRITAKFHKIAVLLASFLPFPPVSSSFIPLLMRHHPLRTAALIAFQPQAFGCAAALGPWLLVDVLVTAPHGWCGPFP